MRISAVLSRSDAPSELVDAELDDPRSDEVIVRIEAAGVCHTDLVTRQRLAGRPAVLGHEGCGTVERVGRAVTGLAAGERVVISFASCGGCAQCRDGRPGYCAWATALNNSGRRLDGSPTLRVAGEPVFASFFGQSSFASAVLTSARQCVPVKDVPPEVAAPLGCGFLTGAGTVLNVLRPRHGDRLLVLGGGGVGSVAALTALSEGVEVVVVEPVESRGALLALYGAKVLPSLRELRTPVSHALDTTGRPEAVAGALGLLQPRGVLALVGLGAATVSLNTRTLVTRGIEVRGSVEGDADPAVLIPDLVRRYQCGLLPLDRLVTTYPLDGLDEAVAGQRAGLATKPVLLPGR
ncbi:MULTISPECIES: alcohol dehydrogenase catalytic domain-containing protein [unclassified Streptomyces]|uniref:alcohol dehydrogenase catalytic domain-containing protein n=1 Tax=unclassified Streptomyces TaxID=2593676 RepID=UPI00081BB844|nr:alcohol dehydrogenase catalytic domain-containing protein [Streptomyces sp. BvitLS-983]MYX88107.1 alcohol dehydrogenase catalytic domain-containing protein [Streptomyces sp. SID4915]SCE12534.1 aryl-alcohol dehydrogenase [Streptomyces sp. BvitLS-983]